MKRKRRGIFSFDLMDQMTDEPIKADSAKIVTSQSDDSQQIEFLEPGSMYNFLIKIAYNGSEPEIDAAPSLFDNLKERFTIALDSSRSVTSFSDIVITTPSAQVVEKFPDKLLFVEDIEIFRNCSGTLVLNAAVTIDTTQLKHITALLVKLCTMLRNSVTTSPYNPLCMSIIPSTNGIWATAAQHNMFYLDESFVRFVKTGGQETNEHYRPFLTCTYGILYNIIRTFRPDDQMDAHDEILAEFPNFSLDSVLLNTTQLGANAQKSDEITFPQDLLDDIMSKKALFLPVQQDAEFRYQIEVFIEPLYRMGNYILNEGYLYPWIEGKMNPTNIPLSKMKDKMMAVCKDKELSIRHFSMKWRVIGARLFLYAFIIPEAVLTEDGEVIDSCFCIKMDVDEKGSHSTDFFIGWFVNMLNENVFQGRIDEERILETLIEDRLKKF